MLQDYTDLSSAFGFWINDVKDNLSPSIDLDSTNIVNFGLDSNRREISYDLIILEDGSVTNWVGTEENGGDPLNGNQIGRLIRLKGSEMNFENVPFMYKNTIMKYAIQGTQYEILENKKADDEEYYAKLIGGQWANHSDRFLTFIGLK